MASTEVPQWFDSKTYYANKLAMWEKDGGKQTDMDVAFLDSGYMTNASGLYRHFIDYGNAEGVSPNQYFNTDEYLRNKTAEFYNVANPSQSQIKTVTGLIQEAGMTPWDHYDRYGWQEGVNPSEKFDTDQYLADKLTQLGSGWTMERLDKALVDSGLNPITHFELYGRTERLSPTAVTVEEGNLQLTGIPDVLQRVPVGLEIGLADFTVQDTGNSILTVSLEARNGEIGGVSDSDPDTPGIQLVGRAATINDVLANLTFEAAKSGESHLDITVSDGQTEITGSYSFFSAWETNVNTSGTEYMRIIGADDFDYKFTAPSAGWGDSGMLSFSNALIVDAEKMQEAAAGATPTHDDGMCWAAQASNLLAWSGWAQQSSLAVVEGPTAEDTVFQAFKDSFLYGETEGGEGQAGFQWFFDGTYPEDVDDHDGDADADMPKEGTGNYLKLDAEDFVYAVTLTGEDPSLLPLFLETAFDLGIGVAVDLIWYEDTLFTDGEEVGGHAITCWGYTYDSSYGDASRDIFYSGYITGLIVSDSDDNRMTPPDQAPDRLKILDLSWDEASSSYYTSAYDGIFGQVEEAFLLLPNSALYDTNVYETAFAAVDALETVGILGVPAAYEIPLDAVA